MKKNLGILGGGQLARMLALKAYSLGLKPFVLSLSSEDPAAQVTPLWHRGNPLKANSIARFLKKVDVLTFESEFVPADQVKKALASLSTPSPLIAPSLKNISLLQDRLFQKKLFQKHGLMTADFVPANESLKDLLKLWGPFVLKTRRGGYDGYGTFMIRNNKFPLLTSPCIAEKYIAFKRELALTAVRNKNGETVFLPLVETKQQNARCLWVCGPVSHKKLRKLKKQITLFLKKTAYQGAITFELFDTGKELLINEAAPRVHNSAHHSLNSLTEDQFTLHLKGIFNLPLTTPQPLTKGFAMLNLLGEGVKKPQWKLPKDVSLHWYGKSSRKGRKMGHINALGSSPLQALRKTLKVRQNFKV